MGHIRILLPLIFLGVVLFIVLQLIPLQTLLGTRASNPFDSLFDPFTAKETATFTKAAAAPSRQELIVKLKPQVAQNVAGGRTLSGSSISDNDPKLKKLKVALSRYSLPAMEKVVPQAVSPQEAIRMFRSKFPQRAQTISSSASSANLSTLYKLKVPQGMQSQEIVKALLATGVVEYVQPNYARALHAVPKDPYFADTPTTPTNRDPNWNPSYDYQWDMKIIGLDKAWEEIRTLPQGVVVAVVDTGVDYTNPEFGSCSLTMLDTGTCPTLTKGLDVLTGTSDPMDEFGHGTHVAGTIVALTNNKVGMAALGGKTKVMPIKVFTKDGDAYDADLAAAIVYAVDNGAQVINASWGGPGQSQLLTDAINYAYSYGVVFVASAGNESDNVANSFPASTTCATAATPTVDCTLTVSATNQTDKFASYSNFGTGIDVSAPGGGNNNVLSLRSTTFYPVLRKFVVGDKYMRLAGTSMAAPHVSALAALVLSKNPTLKSDQVRNVIINGVDDKGAPGFDEQFGFGRIDIPKTLSTMNTQSAPVAIISEPSANIPLGKKFAIKGSSFDTNFAGFSVEITKASLPYAWSSTGVALMGGGKSPVVNGTLATVDLSSLSDGPHLIRLVTKVKNGKNAKSSVKFTLDKSIKNGFPVAFDPNFWEQVPVLADLNNDGKTEILFKNSLEDKLYVLTGEGTSFPNWPVTLNEVNGNYFEAQQPIVTELDPSYPGKEIIQPIGSDDALASYLLAFHADGTPVPGWTKDDWAKKPFQLGFTYGISATQINGQAAIIFPEYDSYSPDYRVFAINSKAEVLPGWPVALPSNGLEGATDPAFLADLDRDGKDEIIINYDMHKLLVYNQSGQLVGERDFSGAKAYIHMIAIGDVAGDAGPEVIVAINTMGGSGTPPGKLYVLNKQLQDISPWPKEVPLSPTDSVNTYITDLGIGNFDSDPKAEVLVSTVNEEHEPNKSLLYLFNGKGKPLTGWPIFVNESNYHFINATLRNNNTLLNFIETSSQYNENDILFHSKIYDSTTGSVTNIEGFPKTYSYSSLLENSMPSMADIDGNGQVDLLIGLNSGTSATSLLYAYEIQKKVSFFDFPQYRHDAQHTGVFKAQ